MKLILEEFIPAMSDRDAIPTDEYTQTNVEEKPADENENFETTLTMIEEVLEEENVVDDCLEVRELMNDLKTVKMKRYEIRLPGVNLATNFGKLDISRFENYCGVELLPILHWAVAEINHE